MDYELVNYINKLEKENLELKKQLEETKGKMYGWDNLKLLIDDNLAKLDLDRTRPFGSFKGKITDAISQIIRETFNLKFIKHLNSSNFEEAKEITDTILDFVNKHFVEDNFYKRNKKEELNE